MANLVDLNISGPIATVTLNRPEVRNALSIDLLTGLHAVLDDLHVQAKKAGSNGGWAVRVVVLTGAGKSFCAGMDLKQVLGEAAAVPKLLTLLAEATVKLRTLPAVTLAIVNGAAIGGGCGLATVCDFAITHADSAMGFPEVDLGVCPAVIAPWLVRKLGAGRARAVLLRGGLMTGRQAHAMGLVDECVETRDGLDHAAAAMTDRLAGGGGMALRATKALLNELDGSLDMDLARRSAKISADVLATPDAMAAIRARMK